MSFDNIPDELKSLIQWCNWKYEYLRGAEKPTKVPYNPITKKHTSSTDPQTWCSFDEAVANVERFDGIGFVFSARDPYCGIDLDYSENPEIVARQQKIFETFDSYSERSPSGKGLHIIIKGNVPQGRRRDAVEIYSSARFFTMTGDVFHNAPIAERQELITILWEEIGPQKETNNFISSLSQDNADDEIYQMAASATNGDKFEQLFAGNWQQYYSSQSQADYALIDIIAYYTQHIPQIVRMFRASGLGQREKANRDKYVYDMIEKSFDNQPPPMDISAILDRLEAHKAAILTRQSADRAPADGPQMASALPRTAKAGTPPAPSRPGRPAGPISDLDCWLSSRPGGVLDSLIHYYMAASPRPVYEISLIAALGLFAGIVGRQYNISNAGLNQYLILVAETGRGKEAIASNVTRTISKLSERIKIAATALGPADMSSGQALLRYLSGRKVPCFTSIIGEFGIRLQQITAENANAADRMLLKVLLDLYGKSGAGNTVQPSVYANKENNTDPIHSPAFTMVGEGEPSRFYEALDERSVAAGLLPRLTIIEYNGKRPPMNYDHGNAVFPENILTYLEQLIAHVHIAADNGTIFTIGETADAQKLMREINDYCDSFMNAKTSEATNQVWNRVHLKIYKLAGLIAVAHNAHTPVVTADMVQWAGSLILTDTFRLLNKFEAGEMGRQDDADNSKQIDRMSNVLYDYAIKEFYELPKYGALEIIHKNKIISYSYISRAVSNSIAFKKDKRGSIAAIRGTIDDLIRSGVLARISHSELKKLAINEGDYFQILPKLLQDRDPT